MSVKKGKDTRRECGVICRGDVMGRRWIAGDARRDVWRSLKRVYARGPGPWDCFLGLRWPRTGRREPGAGRNPGAGRLSPATARCVKNSKSPTLSLIPPPPQCRRCRRKQRAALSPAFAPGQLVWLVEASCLVAGPKTRRPHGSCVRPQAMPAGVHLRLLAQGEL